MENLRVIEGDKLEKLLQENEELATQVAVLRGQLDVASAMSRLRTENEELRNKYNTVQIHRKQSAKQIQQLLDEKEQLRQQIFAVCHLDEDAAENEHHTYLKSELVRLEKEVGKLDEVRRELYDAERKLRALKDDYDALNLERRQLLTQNERLEARNAVLSARCKELENELGSDEGDV